MTGSTRIAETWPSAGLQWKQEKSEKLELVNSNSKSHNNGVDMRKEGRAKGCLGF